jgi:phenylacetate-CoA ligase
VFLERRLAAHGRFNQEKLTVSDCFDLLETRSPVEREAALMAVLPAQIAHAQDRSAAFAQILNGVDPATITSRAMLAHLPVTRKGELQALQQASREQAVGGNVFGGFSAVGFGAGMLRVFASPGPIYEPEGTERDYWRMARAIYAAGFRAGDLIHNSFSYHFVPAGSMMETGAHAVGCTVFPGGTGQTEQQVLAIRDLQPAGYIGTPSFLKIIVDKASDMGVALPSLTKAMFARLVPGAGHCRFPVFCHSGSRADCLRDFGARGLGAG